MDVGDLRSYENFSPFEIKDELIRLAHTSRQATANIFLNAGRGNPNWLATRAREILFLLGQFAVGELKRAMVHPAGIRGQPRADGIANRLDVWLASRDRSRGAAVRQGSLDRNNEAESGRADFVQRDTAQRMRQTNRPADLIAHPRHAALVRPYIGAGDIVHQIADGAGKGADHPLLVRRGHARIAEDHRLAATMGQSRGGVLHRHRTRQAGAFLHTDVRRHPYATDRGATSDVIDHHDGLEADAWQMAMHDLLWTKRIGETEHVFHGREPFRWGLTLYPNSSPRRLTDVNAGKALAASTAQGLIGTRRLGRLV